MHILRQLDQEQVWATGMQGAQQETSGRSAACVGGILPVRPALQLDVALHLRH